MQTGIETLPNGTTVYTTQRHPFGTDAILLGSFCQLRPTFTAVDLGSGSGILLLYLKDRGLVGEAWGVEQDAEGAVLLQKAVEKNAFSLTHAVHTTVQEFRLPRLVDLVIANPPYFTAGLLPQNPQRAAARHQGQGTLDDFCACAQRLLKDKGRFSVCYPATKLATLLHTLQNHSLAPKRLQLVRKTPQAEPWLALVEARKACGEGLTILPDFILPPGHSIHY